MGESKDKLTLINKTSFSEMIPCEILEPAVTIGKSDRILKFFRQNIIVIELYMALVNKKSAPLKGNIGT